jgi:hypothetical protein
MTKRRRFRRSHNGPAPVRTPSLEPMPPLRIEITQEEILANLLYPAERDRREG